MSCCNDTLATLPATAPDISQRVNYAKGMVLGVDDFTQQFAYLAGRDQWAVSELAGYGTTNGLAISVEDMAKGVQLRVSKGAAALKGGQLVCIPSDRCAVLNSWLAKPATAQAIAKYISDQPPQSPPSTATLQVYVRLCFADCLTAMVPIPGEPCRSDEELMAPSRIADSFSLSLDLDAPEQDEEDALRAFLPWLQGALVPQATASPPEGERSWLTALRQAFAPWFALLDASPLDSPPTTPFRLAEYLASAPPAALAFQPSQLADLVRTVIRFWVTELRPHIKDIPCKSGLAEDCLLLAKLAIPVEFIGNAAAGAWQVAGSSADIVIEEQQRPVLAHLRLVEECVLRCIALLGEAAPLPPTPPASPPSSASGVTLVPGAQAFNVNAGHDIVLLQADAAQDIKLPSATAALGGFRLTVKNAGATASKTIIGKGSNKIDGVATRPLAPLEALTLVCDGAGAWHVIGRYI